MSSLSDLASLCSIMQPGGAAASGFQELPRLQFLHFALASIPSVDFDMNPTLSVVLTDPLRADEHAHRHSDGVHWGVPDTRPPAALL
eukprot:1152973-Pelagomonas_calceolata.AAC.4